MMSNIYENPIYYTTATILNWYPLLESDGYKAIIIDSLKFLTGKHLILIFAYVIMPNHIHIIWTIDKIKTKESPISSLFKFTSHAFLKRLSREDVIVLSKFIVKKSDRKHNFWKRNRMDIPIYTTAFFDQKANYIHTNPISGKWSLVEDPVDYRYSSASFYENGSDEFNILTDYYSI